MRSFHASDARSSRRGSVAVIVAVSLTAVIGVLALAIDAGMLFEDRRKCQAAADAAALAAASDLYDRYMGNNGVDTSGTARACALDEASRNGFNNNGTTNRVTVNIPPTQSENFNGLSGHAEVIVEMWQERAFARIWGTGRTRVVARAVARGAWTDLTTGIQALAPTGRAAYVTDGNAAFQLAGSASVIINSNDRYAAETNGNAFAQTSNTMKVVGGWNGNFQDLSGVTQTPEAGRAQPDPLDYIPEPVPGTVLTPQIGHTQTTTRYNQDGIATGERTKSINLNGSNTLPANETTYWSNGNVKQTTVYNHYASLPAGTYNSNDLTWSQWADVGEVVLGPGVHHILGNGGFGISGQVSVRGEGIMIYAEQLSITGQGTVTLSPMTAGVYAGITYFQKRSSTATSLVAGNGNSNIKGAIYNKNGLIDVQGNGDVSLAGQLIGNNIKGGGNGLTRILYDSVNTAKGKIVRLVE